jgi:hypothetical protein
LSIAHVIGVDPGLVHTGVVSLLFKSLTAELVIRHTLVTGPDAVAVAAWIKTLPLGKVYVEQYRPRQNLSSDVRMVQAEQDLRHALKGPTFLPNMGIKRVITEDLMRLLEVWRFPTSTHHQDLRSAARIALLGMVKDVEMNAILADAVLAQMDRQPWTITHE